MNNKIDYKKTFKELYGQSERQISVINVPKFNYLSVDGIGDPNTSIQYKDAVEALFSLSYAIKFIVKKGEENIDYGVMPLEGLWWTDDMKDFSVHNKDIWKWSMMIVQPFIVKEDHVKKAIAEVVRKKDLPALSKIVFKEYDEGLCAQIMHIGPFSEEGPSIERLHEFIQQKGYMLRGLHHEIYLSDPRRSAPDKLKTILRQPIEKIV